MHVHSNPLTLIPIIQTDRSTRAADEQRSAERRGKLQGGGRMGSVAAGFETSLPVEGKDARDGRKLARRSRARQVEAFRPADISEDEEAAEQRRSLRA